MSKLLLPYSNRIQNYLPCQNAFVQSMNEDLDTDDNELICIRRLC